MNLFNKRKQLLVSEMKKHGIKAMVLSPSANMLYATGFHTFPGERLLISVLTDCGELTFIVPKLYEQEVKEKAFFDNLLSWDDSQNPSELLQTVIEKYNIANCIVAIEDTMWYCSFEKILKTLINANYINASEIIGSLRELKSDDEIKKMKNASSLADHALSQTILKIKDGIKEIEVKEILEQEMKKAGLSAPSFDTIIGSGPNSALPHYGAGERVLKAGDSLVVDFGGVFEGYCSDMTRTFVIGKASEEYKKVYSILKEAQQKAIDAVKPGIKARDIDFAARSYIKEMGYGEYFIHRTGHGIGLEVHEKPYITDSSDVILQPGMIFSIEPGIYLSEDFGIRIEDLILVTENGCEVLNKFTKELVEI